jgi:hypothetical protein
MCVTAANQIQLGAKPNKKMDDVSSVHYNSDVFYTVSTVLDVFFDSFICLILFSKVIEICAAIINIFHLIPAASIKLIEPLIQMVLKVENALLVIIVDYTSPSFLLYSMLCSVYSNIIWCLYFEKYLLLSLRRHLFSLDNKLVP